MGGKIKVGTYHEKRGDDRYTAYKSSDGTVVQIEHYDAKAAYSKYQSVNVWTDEAPALIKLIEKAAGIKAPRPEKVEYEYNIERTSGLSGVVSMCYGDSGWDSDLEVVREEFKMYGTGTNATNLGATYRIVKRRKAGEVEGV